MATAVVTEKQLAAKVRDSPDEILARACARELCARLKPRSLAKLLRFVQPNGSVPVITFDICCDAYSAWRDKGGAS